MFKKFAAILPIILGMGCKRCESHFGVIWGSGRELGSQEGRIEKIGGCFRSGPFFKLKRGKRRLRDEQYAVALRLFPYWTGSD